MKNFKSLCITIVLLFSLSVVTAQQPSHKIKVVLFDAFPIFDPRSAGALCEELYPGKGTELLNAWRTRQFEYTWLRSMSGTYSSFDKVTEDALVFACKSLHLELTAEKRSRLVNIYSNLKAWPDVLQAIKQLKSEGIKVGFLSNFTVNMLQSDVKAADLTGVFDYMLSTDMIKGYKPSPAAYQLGINKCHCRKDEIVFVAFAGWDAAGAKAFGYNVYWVNRLNAPMEELQQTPDKISNSLDGLLDFIHTR